MIIWAKLQDENNKIRGFIVERNFKGVSTPKIEGKFSLRASDTGMIILDDVKGKKKYSFFMLLKFITTLF